MAFLENLVPFFAVDTVAVFDQNFNQIFPQARAIKAVIKEEAKVMEHPVETGATIVDHRIILPIQIELSLVIQSLDYPNVYKSIQQYYLNSTLLVVQTKSDTYTNQLIESMPHEEDPEMFSTITIALKLKQVQFVTAQVKVVPKSASNATKTSRGTQNPAPATGQQSQLAATNFIGK